MKKYLYIDTQVHKLLGGRNSGRTQTVQILVSGPIDDRGPEKTITFEKVLGHSNNIRVIGGDDHSDSDEDDVILIINLTPGRDFHFTYRESEEYSTMEFNNDEEAILWFKLKTGEFY